MPYILGERECVPLITAAREVIELCAQKKSASSRVESKAELREGELEAELDVDGSTSSVTASFAHSTLFAAVARLVFGSRGAFV